MRSGGGGGGGGVGVEWVLGFVEKRSFTRVEVVVCVSRAMGNGRIVLPTDLRFRSSGGVSRSSSKGDGVGVNGKRRDALLYREYFSSSELNALCNYENRGCDRSITYKYVMSPFYDWLVEFLPLWLAPNVITLLGLITVVVPHVLLMLHAPTMSEEAPRWVYALNCVGLFAYMVLDNLDGRQARRTGSSSPLGHLVDHTCDALNVLITGLSVATTLRMGTTIYTLLLVSPYLFAHLIFGLLLLLNIACIDFLCSFVRVTGVDVCHVRVCHFHD